MKKEDEENEYKISLIWGIIFIALFLLYIILATWAVETGNYNTP